MSSEFTEKDFDTNSAFHSCSEGAWGCAWWGVFALGQGLLALEVIWGWGGKYPPGNEPCVGASCPAMESLSGVWVLAQRQLLQESVPELAKPSGFCSPLREWLVLPFQSGVLAKLLHSWIWDSARTDLQRSVGSASSKKPLNFKA